MIALDLLLVSAVAVGAARETTNFDFGWRHQLGEPTGQPSLRDYDDSAWPVINAPHDMLINTPRSQKQGENTLRLRAPLHAASGNG